MHSTTIFLFAFGLLAAVTLARPGHNHGNGDTSVGKPEGSRPPWGGHGHGKFATFRAPRVIRLPRRLAGKLSRPLPAFSVKKVHDGKFLLISPALLFRVKKDEGESGSTTISPILETSTFSPSTTEDPEVEETTTAEPDEEETTTPEEGEELDTTTPASFFAKRSLALDDNEQLFFDEE